MKKTFLLTTILLLYYAAFSTPVISNISSKEQVCLYDKIEISFTMTYHYSNDPNPYDSEIIDAYAIFIGPNEQEVKVNAFYFEDCSFYYDEGYEKPLGFSARPCWKIRFTPNLVGVWTYTIHAEDSQSGTATTQRQFECTNLNNAKGFISKANSRYLKQTRVSNGQENEVLYFPVGSNIAHYTCKDYGVFIKPIGIYEYYEYIDKLAEKGNYFRLFLNRYPFLSLYGMEYTTGVNFFNNTLNQKDARELDYIIDYAKEHDICIMPCIFGHKDFVTSEFYNNDGNDEWEINPSHTEIETINLNQEKSFDYKGSLIVSYNNIFTNTITIDLSSYRNGFYIIKNPKSQWLYDHQ